MFPDGHNKPDEWIWESWVKMPTLGKREMRKRSMDTTKIGTINGFLKLREWQISGKCKYIVDGS